MKNIIFAVLLVTIFVVSVSSTPTTTKPKKCNSQCGDNYNPVCGGPSTGSDRPLSFGSSCVLEKYNCENNKNFVVKSQGECPGGGGVRLQ